MGLSQFRSPTIRILYNNKDKTHLFNWTNISINDYESGQADTLSLTLLWQNAQPRFKDEIKIYIDEKFLGSFIVSAIKYNYLQNFQIEATSADFMGGFKTKKNRTFKKLSFENIIKSIAKENNFKYKIDFKRAVEVTNLEQHNESDAAICQKISNDLALTFSVKNKTLIFIDKDKDIKRVEYNLNEDEIINLNYEYIEVEKFSSCEITWQDTKKGKKQITKFGKEAPVLKLSAYAKDANDALRIAKTKLQNQKDKELKGSLSCLGVPFFAGGFININLQDLKLKGIISHISHSITPSGWNSQIEFF